jgi:hypothetical protein
MKEDVCPKARETLAQGDQQVPDRHSIQCRSLVEREPFAADPSGPSLSLGNGLDRVVAHDLAGSETREIVPLRPLAPGR